MLTSGATRQPSPSAARRIPPCLDPDAYALLRARRAGPCGWAPQAARRAPPGLRSHGPV